MVYWDMRHIFNYGIMYTRFLIKTTQPAMFAATKLRRGMIPKDKEGGGCECGTWSHGRKLCVTTSLGYFLFLLIEAAIGWQEDRCHATLSLLSTT